MRCSSSPKERTIKSPLLEDVYRIPLLTWVELFPKFGPFLQEGLQMTSKTSRSVQLPLAIPLAPWNAYPTQKKEHQEYTKHAAPQANMQLEAECRYMMIAGYINK